MYFNNFNRTSFYYELFDEFAGRPEQENYIAENE